MQKTYIGIDNGVTGSIAVLHDGGATFIKTPIKKEQNYTKAKANITRIDSIKLIDILSSFKDNSFAFIERPMVNPTRFQATTSALRALEATLTVIENLGIPYQYCDSKSWQKELLPKGSEKEQLKDDSKTIGIRLFPHLKEKIEKHGDADSLLIAEYARRKNL